MRGIGGVHLKKKRRGISITLTILYVSLIFLLRRMLVYRDLTLGRVSMILLFFW